jgi:hypothetical protein
MSKAKSVPAKPVYVPPSQIVWTDERLAALDTSQLANLLDNLQTQRACGRVPEATAVELEVRIRSRLPARVAAPRRRRPLSEVRMEARATERLGTLARQLERRFDLSREAAAQAARATKGFKPHSMTDSKGQPRTGAAVRSGAAVVERYVGYRAGDSFAGLAFVVLPGQQPDRGTYVLLGTSDLIDGDSCTEYLPVATEHGWSAESRACMRAVAMADFDEGAGRCADLIERLAPPAAQ